MYSSIMEDATFEDLLERDECKSFHENNIHILRTEIYKSLHHPSPPIMKNCFGLKLNQYNLSVINYWSFLPQILTDMVHGHSVLKEVFLGIRFQANIKT